MLENYDSKKRDFKCCYHKTLRRYNEMGVLPSNSRLIAETVMGEAPGYYITFEYARRLLGQYRRGRLPHTLSPLRRLMIAEIDRRVNLLMSGTNSHAVGEALSKVLAMGRASRFFITTATAMRLLYN